MTNSTNPSAVSTLFRNVRRFARWDGTSVTTTLITRGPINSCRLEQIDTRNHEADAVVVVVDDRMLATDQQCDDGIAILTAGADVDHLWSERGNGLELTPKREW